MKCLVFSDSHGRWDLMARAVEGEKPDRVLHLGDVTRDAQRLLERFPAIELEQVRGNCDGWGSPVPEEKELFLGGKRIWMLHGHTYWVKSGLSMLLEEARTRGADLVTFGHTHRPLCDREGRLWILNPGAIGGPAPLATYGVIQVEGGTLSCRTAVLK